MKLLIVDNSTESQAFCAKRIESFNQFHGLQQESADREAQLLE